MAVSLDEYRRACAELAGWLPVAAALMAEPDVGGSAGKGQTGSRPPWNGAAASAYTTPYEGVRRLKASLLLAITGHPGARCGGSDANTMAAIKAIEKLGTGVSAEAVTQIARILDRWSRAIEELPAVDEVEPWRRVTGVACPYCGCAMLRVQPREGTVTCLRYGACRDSDGHHPVGRMDVSRLTGDPLIRWADGLVAP